MHLPLTLQQFKGAASYCLLALGFVTATLTSPKAYAQGSAPVAELAGNYMGSVSALFLQNKETSTAPPPSSIPNEDLGARIDLSIGSTGVVSGKMAFGPTVIPLAGALVVTNGQAEVTLELPITRYSRTLRIFLNPSMKPSTGTLAYGIGSTTSDGQYVSIYKNTWSGRTPAAYLTAYQTFFISSGKRAIILPDVFLSSSPQGYGFGSIRANGTSGNYNIAGTLADGNKFTTSGFYGSQGQVLIYQYLYASLGGGVFSCRGNIRAGIEVSIAQDTNEQPYVNGEYTWIKRPSPQRTTTRSTTWKRFAVPSTGPADTLYPLGFYQSSEIQGSPYIAPAAGQVLFTNGLTSAGPPASVATSVRFLHQSLFTINFSQGVTITSPSNTSRINQISVTSPVRNSVRFTQFDVSTGSFRGTFTLTPPLRPATFEGMLVKNFFSTRYNGYGYFIIRDLKSSTQTLSEITPQLSDQRVSGNVYLGISEG